MNESCSDSFLAVRLQKIPSFAVNNNISIIYHAKIRFQIRDGRKKGLQLIGVSRKWQTIFLSGRSKRKTKFTLQKVPSNSDSLKGNAEQAFNDMKFLDNVSEK